MGINNIWLPIPPNLLHYFVEGWGVPGHEEPFHQGLSIHDKTGFNGFMSMV